MSEVAQNPPLASYFAALVGSVAGWSETALHLGFILPALGVVLGTYRLALRFTQQPLIAAAATLLAPGFLVSATGLMCDTMMLALWVLAVVFWVEGLDEPDKPLYLAISSLLIAACALTKYFGLSLIPLLLVYSLVRKRRLGSWAGFLLIPLFVMGGYEVWTRALYGRGLLSAPSLHRHGPWSRSGATLQVRPGSGRLGIRRWLRPTCTDVCSAALVAQASSGRGHLERTAGVFFLPRVDQPGTLLRQPELDLRAPGFSQQPIGLLRRRRNFGSGSCDRRPSEKAGRSLCSSVPLGCRHARLRRFSELGGDRQVNTSVGSGGCNSHRKTSR